jgi:hypothetical protein
MLAPNPSGTVGRSSRRPTIARGCTASSKEGAFVPSVSPNLSSTADTAGRRRGDAGAFAGIDLVRPGAAGVAHRVDKARKLLPLPRRPRRGRGTGLRASAPPRRSGPAAGARVGRVDGVGDTACRLDSAGRYAGATALPDPVDRRRLACASVRPLLRFPAQAHAGAGTSGPDATFLLGNLFVRRPVRATSLDPRGSLERRSPEQAPPLALPPPLRRARAARSRRSLAAGLIVRNAPWRYPESLGSSRTATRGAHGAPRRTGRFAAIWPLNRHAPRGAVSGPVGRSGRSQAVWISGRRVLHDAGSIFRRIWT